MDVIQIHTRLDSETLHLPQLRPLIGKMVEIVVREENSAAETPRSPYAVFFDLSGKDVVDPEAYQQLRAASLP